MHPQGNHDLLPVVFATPRQVRPSPPPLEFLSDQSLGLGFFCFPPLLPAVIGSRPTAHLLQQVPPKLLAAQTPATPDRLPFLVQLRRPPRLHPQDKFPPLRPDIVEQLVYV